MNVSEPLGTAEPTTYLAGEPQELDALLGVTVDEMMNKTKVHQETWHFGEEEQWHLDLESGELILRFPEQLVSAPAQVIGMYEPDKATWTWAWADTSIAEHLKTDASRVKEYGRPRGFERLVSPEWTGEATEGWYMAAIACWLCNAQGAYRGRIGRGWLFITFGEIKKEPSSLSCEAALAELVKLTVADFRLCAGSLAHQQLACCRYFKRGVKAGFSQVDLVDRLGLSAPSVLEMAGYPAEVVQQVMDMSGRLTNEEIEGCEI
jgi:uncharacterized protein DUF6882